MKLFPPTGVQLMNALLVSASMIEFRQDFVSRNGRFAAKLKQAFDGSQT
ncbi:MAG TPA: hypothetical protein VL970_00075 [Candidatus Acidoferrales bacterium]|nr:hypothetical protein [Candidatus Acidoferrales bacterium]